MVDYLDHSNPAFQNVASAEAFAMNPTRDVDLPNLTRQITVGTAGSLNVKDRHGVTVNIPATVITAQPVQNIVASQILSTSTAVDVLVKY